MKFAISAVMCVLTTSVPLLAQTSQSTAPIVMNDDVGVPVFPHDITDRPYRVLGEVKAGVRKATMFSKSPSQAKIYRELWERGRKLGADAVIKASYGDAHVTAVRPRRLPPSRDQPLDCFSGRCPDYRASGRRIGGYRPGGGAG
jgi:hypothetical protein